MKIGFDATSLSKSNLTGIEYYALNLLKELLIYDNENEYIVFFRNDVHKELIPYKDKFKSIIIPIKNQWIVDQIILPICLYREKLDLVHFPAFPPPAFYFGNIYLTIHDATVWKYPKTMSLKGYLYFKILYEISLFKNVNICVNSISTKNDISNFLKKALNIRVIYHAYDNSKFNTDNESKVKLKYIRDQYKLPSKYILFVGTNEPRKNLKLLLKAYSILKSNDPIEEKIVICGRKGWIDSSFDDLMMQLGIEKDIIFTGYVKDEDVKSLYRMASLFVFPSIYEGFGVPMLEAMACGIPVIAANNSCIPEIGGEAVHLFDDNNEFSLAEEISYVLKNKEKRDTLIKKGLENVKRFSWAETAKATLLWYKRGH
ncbi:MAG: glycosyltransferase family 1 protein [Clostridiales bacterium]|jgi:glycosyltransferase involved in cell wall biosynthesis|nr:glycosyltransferase family 4 protein [Eubacteriales bacterium]MDH7566504.1 glycosyltransferase family 1 protein [Clostridiales bacterium]